MSSIAIGITLLTVLFAGSPLSTEPLVEPSSALQFERTPTVDGKPFICLGAGIRKKYFFRVYAIDFCIEQAAGRAGLAKYFAGPGKKYADKQGAALGKALSHDPEFFQLMMEMPVDKVAQFVFVRNISLGTLRDVFAWRLTQVLGVGEKPRIDAFLSMLDRDIKEGDRMSLRTTPNDEVSVSLGVSQGINDPKLARAVWQPYLGPDSITPSLKDSVAMGAAALRGNF